jgi:cGMP-dependent protein kinase
MRGLEHNSIVEIITNTPLYSVKKDIKIYEEGNLGNFFFIIQKGSIKLNTEDTKEKVLKSGDYFGELALLQEDKRKFTARSLEETYLYCIERKEFRRIINKINKQNFEENKSLIESIGVLSLLVIKLGSLDNDQQTLLIFNLVKEIYDPNTIIVKEGDVGECLFIIKEGEVECVSNNSLIRTLKKGDVFGEKSILHNNLRTMNVISKRQTTLFSVNVEILKMILGEKYKEMIILNMIKAAFKSSNLFKNLNTKLLDGVYDYFIMKNYMKNHVVVGNDHTMGSKILVVLEGGISTVLFF